jgi:hypothetical protein
MYVCERYTELVVRTLSMPPPPPFKMFHANVTNNKERLHLITYGHDVRFFTKQRMRQRNKKTKLYALKL